VLCSPADYAALTRLCLVEENQVGDDLMTFVRFMAFDLLFGGLVAADLVHTLLTGRAWAKAGNVARDSQPDSYWRYVYSSCALLSVCGLAFVAIITLPQTLG
jgi:hypothetical protein